MRKVIPGLQPGTAYAIQVRANDGSVQSEWSSRFEVTTKVDTTLPKTPTNFTWNPVNDSFFAEWDAVTQNVDNVLSAVVGYEIELTASGITKMVSVVQQTGQKPNYSLSYETNKSLFTTARPVIDARVRAVDNKGLKSAWTTAVTATNPIPTAPTNVVATAAQDQINLNWTASTDEDVVGYNVYTSADVFIGFANATTYIYRTATYSAQSFKVAAVDKFNQSSTRVESNAVTPISPFIVDTTPPAVPTSLAASLTNNANGNTARATVTWTNPTDTDFAGTELQYRRNSDASWSSMVSGPGVAAVIVDLPTPYVAYDFRIRAFDKQANYSSYSSTLAKAAVANVAPATVSSLSATPGRDSITYSWPAVADADIKNYELTFSTSSTFASGNITFLTGTSTTLTVSGLSPSTTYYARVRAVDTGGLTSSAFTATNTSSTTAFPASSQTDGFGPASSPTPTVTPSLGELFVTWAPVTTNSNGGSQVDPVTYEVHISVTDNFTPNAGTKAMEVSATGVVLKNTAGGTPLSYSTTYYVKIVAKDRDNSAAASSQGSGQISKVASTDVISIGANLIVPGTGIIGNLVIKTPGSIQSDNYSSTAGYRLSDTGLEINSAGSSIKADAIKAGTLGGTSGSGVIQVAAGTSLVFNGGHLKSNTYGKSNVPGTAYDATADAGFYLGNDGLRIAQGSVSASAFATGTLTASTITMGSNAIIQTSGYSGTAGTGGFRLTSSGLEIPDGTLSIAKVNVVNNSIPGTAITSIDGGKITTGSIQSQQNITIDGTTEPLWIINTSSGANPSSAAIFSNLKVRGTTVLGKSATDTTSILQSSNYLAGSAGWALRGNGTLDLLSVQGQFIKGDSIQTNTLSPGKLKDGAMGSTIQLTGNLQAIGNLGELVEFGREGFSVTGPAEVVISNMSIASGGVVTVTTDQTHNFVVNSPVTVMGVGDEYDGNYIITEVPSSTQVKFNTTSTLVSSVSPTAGILYGIDPKDTMPRRPFVSFPSTIGKPNIVSGNLQSGDLTVDNSASFKREISLEIGSVMRIASTVFAPKASPSVSAFWTTTPKVVLSSGTANIQSMTYKDATTLLLDVRDYTFTNGAFSATTNLYEYSLTTDVLSTSKYSSPQPQPTNEDGNYENTDSLVKGGNFYYLGRQVGGSNTFNISVINSSYALVSTFTITLAGNANSRKAVLGWNNTNGRLIVLNTSRFESSPTYTIDEYAVNSSTGAITAGTAATISANNLSGWYFFSSVEYIERGAFDFGTGVDVYLAKSADSFTYRNFATTNITSMTQNPNYQWQTPTSGNGADAAGTSADTWNPSSGKFYRTQSNYIVTYANGSSWWTNSSDNRHWFAYSFYKAVTTATPTAERQTELSPATSIGIPKRAIPLITTSPIPGGTSNELPKWARVYMYRGTSQPTSATKANWQLKTGSPGADGSIRYPGASLLVNPNQADRSEKPVYANEFLAAANPAIIQSTSGNSFWKGDDTAQFFQLVVNSTTDADPTSSTNKPALRIGDPTGSHMRVDNNEFIVMTTPTTQGTLVLNSGAITQVGGFQLSGGTITSLTGSVDFSATDMSLRIVGSTNFAAKIATKFASATGASLVFANNQVTAAIQSYAGATLSSSNTVSMYASDFYALGQTGSAPIAAQLSAAGRLIRNTSSRRYKKNIKPLDIKVAKTALDLEAVTFVSKVEIDPSGVRRPGFIAEQAHDAGANLWVAYNDEGEPEAFHYAELSAAHNMLLKDLYGKVDSLEAENTELKSRISDLEQSVQKILSKLGS